MLTRSIDPLPHRFVEHLQDYCEQAKNAIKRNKHHDQRRALFMDFLRKAFNVSVDEVDLEHKVKAASARDELTPSIGSLSSSSRRIWSGNARTP